MIEILKEMVEAFEIAANGGGIDFYAYAKTGRQAIAELESQEQVSYSGNGTAGRENMTAPTGFFFQMPKAEKQEPVAWMYDWTTSEGEFIQDWTTSEAETLRDTEPTIISNVRPLYTHPPQRTEPKVCCQEYDTCLEPCTPRGEHLAQRTWVGLTDEEMKRTCYEVCSYDPYTVARAIEAKLKEKNT